MDAFWRFIDPAIYGMQALVALLGLFFVILLVRRISQKRFSGAAASDQFLEDVRERLSRKDFDGVVALCDSPPYWSKAVPQLILVAMENLSRPAAKLRRLLADKFEREILADLEYGTSWVATVVKAAPMLGLLGTVIGMINAFGKIAAAQSTGTDPKQLAGDISFALLTTAIGLMTALPLVLAGNMLHVRIGKLQDSVQHDLGVFLDDLDAVTADETGRAAT